MSTKNNLNRNRKRIGIPNHQRLQDNGRHPCKVEILFAGAIEQILETEMEEQLVS